MIRGRKWEKGGKLTNLVMNTSMADSCIAYLNRNDDDIDKNRAARREGEFGRR